ncbi:hypothetical protein RhiirA5_447312, partial [Rhizophagus irregularis]
TGYNNIKDSDVKDSENWDNSQNSEIYFVIKLEKKNSKKDQLKINPETSKHIHKQFILVDF